MEIRSSNVHTLENYVKPNNKKRARDGEESEDIEESGEQKEPERKQRPKTTVLPTMGKDLPSTPRNPDNDGSGNVQPVS